MGDVWINMTGPADKWFAVGFDSMIMDYTYAIIACSNDSAFRMQENQLADDAAGIRLKQTIDVRSESVENDIRSVMMNRKIEITVNDTNQFKDYYTFPTSPTVI